MFLCEVVIKMILYIRIWSDIFETVNLQGLIKNDAGEARVPSRKMRLDKCCRNLPELLSLDLYGASYDNFTETDQYL